MNSSIQIFNNNEFSVRTIRDDDGTIWFVAKDVALALEYEKWQSNIVAHVPNIWKGVKRINTPGGNQDILCLTEQGVYFFLGRSDKPQALPYQMWIAGDVVPSIRETGSYSIKQSDEKDIEVRLKELEDHKRDQDLLGAQILQSMIDKELFPVTPETRTVFAHEVFKLVTGHSYLGMLPECTEKWFTAGETGEAVGLSANMVGRIAKKNGIQAPEGESMLGISGTALEAPTQNQLLNPTENGLILGKSPRYINQLLELLGFQEKVEELLQPIHDGEVYKVN